MSIICWLFGHSQVRSFSEFSGMGGGEYAMGVRGPREDGIHRSHFDLIAQCPRCGERYLACKIHGHWITDLEEVRLVSYAENMSTCTLIRGDGVAYFYNLEMQYDGVKKFGMGDRVRKIKGSKWVGHVVGIYSTELTPEGYAVESETETGSVQIYPAAALEAAPNEL